MTRACDFLCVCVCIRGSWVRVPTRAAGEFSSPESTFCADSYFGIRSPLVLLQYHIKDFGHSAKSAGGRLQLNTHAAYLSQCGFEQGHCKLHGCTQNLRRDGSSITWHQPCNKQNSDANTLVDIQKALCKATVTHSQSHTTRAQWVCSDAENGAIVAIVKRLALISG